MDKFIITTTPTIEGHPIKAYLRFQYTQYYLQSTDSFRHLLPPSIHRPPLLQWSIVLVRLPLSLLTAAV